METTANAPFVCPALNLLEQLFSKRASFYWSNSGEAVMLLWLGSGERPGFYTGDWVGCFLGLNFAEKRRMFATSEDGDDGEANSTEVADVKPYTEEETLVQLPASMSPAFGHAQSYQIRPNNPPKQVLRMRRLGGAGAQEQFMADNPPPLIETKQQAWVKKKWPNEGTEKRISKLKEDTIETAMDFLQSQASLKMPVSLVPTTRSQTHSSESSSLKPPEPNAPL